MRRPKPDPVKQGEESVWDYPRPPRLEKFGGEVVVFFAGRPIAKTVKAYRVLETSHPPGYYLPPEDVDQAVLQPSPMQTNCEWKGRGRYFHLISGDQRSENAAWYYETPTPAFAPIAGYISFYPGRTERCTVNGETVIPQPGEFYGGWVTSNIKGPFKGIEGSWGW